MGTMEHVDGSDRKPEAMYDAVLAYLKAGGRHLDCAECYQSTPHVGRAIADSGVSRAELHVTTKLSGLPCDYAEVKQRLVAHYAALGVERADLLLVHWPGPAASEEHAGEAFSGEHTRALLGDPDALRKACTWAYFDSHIEQAWRNMQQLRDEGLCAKIGVSNFYRQHLRRLAECGGEAPFANEIYIDATHQEREFVEEMIGAGMPAVHRLVECHQDRCVIRAGRCQLRVGLTGLGPGLRLGLVLAIRVQGLSLWRGRP